jgi:hypothetical protein
MQLDALLAVCSTILPNHAYRHQLCTSRDVQWLLVLYGDLSKYDDLLQVCAVWVRAGRQLGSTMVWALSVRVC